MKLILVCTNCNKKVTLNSLATSRPELAKAWGANFNIACPYCSFQNLVHPNQVRAESTLNNMSIPVGAIIGGLIGLLAGPLGLIIGSAAGGTTGTVVDRNKEKKAVDRFNLS